MRVGRRVVVGIVLGCCLAVLLPAASASAQGSLANLLKLDLSRGDRYKPKPAGTIEDLRLYFGPYVVPPGWDANRIDLDLPPLKGYILSVEPGMRRLADGSEPGHQEAHIHHAHWFGLDIGNKEDNYLGGIGEWIFGNGDEETKADFTERSAAEPDGPIYGNYINGSPQLMIYMLHNKTSQMLNVHIVLDVTFLHGDRKAAEAKLKRPVHDVTGTLFGRTFNVPRQPDGDGRFDTTHDHPKPIEWTSTVDGTIIGTGSHLHPGGLRVQVENLGSKSRPCPDDGKATGGTLLYNSDALFRSDAMFSEDFQMEVTHPAWRAPIRKGDVIRATGIYENKDHAWYDVMTHQGLYIDEEQKPREGCRPYFVGGVKERKTVTKRKKVVRYKKVKIKRGARAGKTVRKKIVFWRKVRTTTGVSLHDGVPNRPWLHHPDLLCGEDLGALPCERPESPRPPGQFVDTVAIANFLYLPGDLSLSGDMGAPPRVQKGKSLTFLNVDQVLNIRHTITTCAWPCNGRYVANYPFADGVWDSTTLGYDLIDGGNPNPIAKTPPTLDAGKYAYFCRIHPWMRGAFEVVD